MHKLFHGKYVVVAKVQPNAKTQIVTMNVNVMDVNVTIKSKVIEEQVFKDRAKKRKERC